jgi:hypothetical protein
MTTATEIKLCNAALPLTGLLALGNKNKVVIDNGYNSNDNEKYA